MRFLSSTLAALAVAGAAHAQAIRISDAWIRPPPPGAPTAAGYATVTNASRRPDALIGGFTPAAARVEVHQMSMAGGVMRMRPVTGGLPIPPGGTVRLAPGGLHLMLIGPTRPLRPGDKVPVTLRFMRGGAVRTVFTVRTASSF